MFQQKSLIIVFLTLFAASAVFLFWQNERELNPDRAGNWWTLSFSEPASVASLTFVIENHSDATHFSYQVVSDKIVYSESNFFVEKGDSITLTPKDPIGGDGSRISIIVSDGAGKKEIYK
jgi:hypothetical protein